MKYLVIKKHFVKIKFETPKKIWVDQLFCLGIQIYAFKCGYDSKNKLKSIGKSQSKNIKIEEYKKSLYREEYQQECDKYIFKSFNHEIKFQKVFKSTLSAFDDKRCHETNIKSKFWG